MFREEDLSYPSFSDAQSEARADWLPALTDGRHKFYAALEAIEPKQFDKGEILWTMGETAPGVHQLVHGWALRSRVLRDGRSVAMNCYLPGDIIGIAMAIRGSSPDEISLLTPCELRFVTNRAVREMWSDPATAIYLGWLLSRKQWRSDARSAGLSVGTARERFAFLALYYHTRLHRSGHATADSYTIPLNQQQIADLIGSTVVHANRTLRWFETQGMVVIAQKQLMIKDFDRLRTFAMEDVWRATTGIKL